MTNLLEKLINAISFEEIIKGGKGGGETNRNRNASDTR